MVRGNLRYVLDLEVTWSNSGRRSALAGQNLLAQMMQDLSPLSTPEMLAGQQGSQRGRREHFPLFSSRFVSTRRPVRRTEKGDATAHAPRARARCTILSTNWFWELASWEGS
jgi:hypothetical protein